ncbi:MAG: HDOD domain-containing protein [Gammaproteobacteria bacterium]
MVEPELSAFPLVALQPAANAHHDWTAILLRCPGSTTPAVLAQVFGSSALLTAVAPLDVVVFLDQPLLDPALRALLPVDRIVIALPAACLAQPEQAKAALALQTAGYRILIDGPAPAGLNIPATLRGISASAGQHPSQVPQLFAPHLVRNVATGAQLDACRRAGFTWFSGAYMAEGLGGKDAQQDGVTRKRLLALLGALARDADSRELENLLKQDPALSYHLLKLANSAAFAVSTPIHSFGQAINVLGRRQLQRWLQLLLYARAQHDGPHNPMLPIAALRAGALEMLCRLEGGDAKRRTWPS